MRKVIIISLLVLSGCATINNVKDYSIMALYASQHKVLIYIQSPCAYSHTNKPAFVSEWVREKNLNNMMVVCDNECNCKLVSKDYAKTHKVVIINKVNETPFCN